MKTAVLFNCQKIAKELAEQQGLRDQATEAILVIKKKLKGILEKSYLPDLNEEEKKFLNLIVCPDNNDWSIRKTVFDTIIDNCVGEMSQIPDEASLVIPEMLIRITGDELNQNGFRYDSGRSEIRSTVDSAFEKLLVHVSFKEFDYNDKHVFAFATKQSELA